MATDNGYKPAPPGASGNRRVDDAFFDSDSRYVFFARQGAPPTYLV